MLWDYTQKSRWQFWLKGLVEDVHEFPNVGLGSWWLKKGIEWRVGVVHSLAPKGTSDWLMEVQSSKRFE